MTANLLKLKATLWKCYIGRKKHYVLTLFVIGLPVLLFGLFGYARSQVGFIGKELVNHTTYNEIFYEAQIYEKYRGDPDDTLLCYTPETGFTADLMRKVQLKLNLLSDRMHHFDTETELLEKCKQNNTNVIFAVVFRDLQGDNIPKNLNYDIRNFEKHFTWHTDQLFNMFSMDYIPGTGSENYLRGFYILQMAIDTLFVEASTGEAGLPVQLAMQEFPYPPYLRDPGINDIFMTILPFVTLFSFILVCPATLKRIVEEKHSGIKELMKMMGLPTSVMWLTWFIDAIIVNAFSLIFIVVCMKVDWGDNTVPIEHCNGLILYIFLLLYCSACITLCFVISTLLSSPNFTTVIGILFWIMSYLIPYTLGGYMSMMSFNVKMLFCLFPNVSMYYGYQAISTYEMRGMGLQWGNLFTSAGVGDNDITVGHIFIMLIVDIMVFLLLTYYVDSVRPGKYGLGKPWTFPLKDLKRSLKTRRNSNLIEPVPGVSNDYVKIENCGLKPGIQIMNMFKYYQSKLAVNDLSINFYKGEITVLLGHNGAGKTTTMSIICGMMKSTKGSVFIDDVDITNNIDYVRSMIGICPQHNLVFPDLSVQEHLTFFAMLNGVKEAQSKIVQLLHKLDMYRHRDKVPSALSGGMKRKLCLGMALILEPKVLILDEPTSGLDPKSRREIWDILLNWRKEANLGKCTVLISTHFMEEAEVLGDRIAIMDHGNLIAFGTPMYLKNEYNTGYILTVIKEKNSRVDDAVIDAAIKEVAFEAVPKIKMHMTNTYTLPNDKDMILKVIKHLEHRKQELEIDNITISITTLEDVFLRISNLVSKTEEEPDTGSELSVIYTPSTYNYYRTLILMKNHFKAIQKLWRTCFIYILLCLIIILMALLLGSNRQFSFISHKEQLKLDLSVYGQTEVFCSGTGNDAQRLLGNYETVAKTQQGLVTITQSVSEGLIQMGIEYIENYKQHAIVAAEFNQTGNELVANAMYSNGALHGAPIALNLIMNAIAKTYIGPEASITTANVPLPTDSSDVQEVQVKGQIILLWMLLTPMGLTFAISIFLIHPFRERSSNMKHLLYMTGLKSYNYWFQMFLFDFIFYFFITLLILLVIVLSFNPIFSDIYTLESIFCILMVYGVVAIPYIYLFSYKQTISSAISLLQILNLLIGFILTFIVYVLQHSGDAKFERIGDWMNVASSIIPQYWLARNLMMFSTKATSNYNWNNLDRAKKIAKCTFYQNPCCISEESKECHDYQSYFVEGLAPLHILYFLLVFLFYFALLIILDSFWLSEVRDKVEDSISTVINKFKKQELVSPISGNNKDQDCSVISGNNKHEPMSASNGLVHSESRGEKLQDYSNKLIRRNKQQELTNAEEGALRPIAMNDRIQESFSAPMSRGKQEDSLSNSGVSNSSSEFNAKDVTKKYGGREVVKNVSFRVKNGACFGLLGVNGAGKTTTFKILTGSTVQNDGTAKITTITDDAKGVDNVDHGDTYSTAVTIDNDPKNKTELDLINDRDDYLSEIGYCPQFDAMNSIMTGRELLTLFLRLRGTHDNVDEQVKTWINVLGLEKYADMACGKYSGGNKRKLALGMSLIANRKVIMLDEPTSGVDPVSRRKLWTVLRYIKAIKKQSIILTSHSMDECEALCDELAIIKSGEIKCLDNVPNLKINYGKGYTVSVKVKRSESIVMEDCVDSGSLLHCAKPEIDDVEEQFKEYFKPLQPKLKDKHLSQLHFYLPNMVQLSVLFERMEDFKSMHGSVEDYVINMATLEDVFLSVSSDQGLASNSKKVD